MEQWPCSASFLSNFSLKHFQIRSIKIYTTHEDEIVIGNHYVFHFSAIFMQLYNYNMPEGNNHVELVSMLWSINEISEL